MEKRGEKIKNSKLYRDFCFGCGAPIRVRKSDLRMDNHSEIKLRNVCEDCEGHQAGMIRGEKARTAAQKVGLQRTCSQGDNP